MSDMAVSVDGLEYSGPRSLMYRGMMLSDVPNFAFSMGYSNASWTLKADLVFYPRNHVGGGWGIGTGAIAAVRIPKILVLNL